MFYDKYCYIVREGDPIDAVFFITNGIVRTYTSNNGEGFSITDDIVRTNTSNNGEGSDSQHAKDLEKDKFFGGELLELVLKSTADDISKVPKVPVSSKTLKTYTKVEAFALMAHDLKRIWQSKRISKCKSFLLFYTKNLFFLFYTPIFIKHPHQSIYFTHLFNKIFIFFTIFLLFPHSLLISLTYPTLPKKY